MTEIKNYKHNIGIHCESGSIRNILNYSGLNISEPMAFGLGTGIVFAYLIKEKGLGGFPITAIRFPMGSIFKNLKKLLKIDFFYKKIKTNDEAFKLLNELIEKNIPSALCVDMFYMKYLPVFMQIHVPFHFVVPVGYDKDNNEYLISDPYFQKIAKLSKEHLKSAWETHAKFSNDNLLCYVKKIPDTIDWKFAIKKAIIKTCNSMNIPFPICNMLPLFGVKGIKLYAKHITDWPKKFRGLALREGILFTPTVLEEQGTGGGAFRFIYASFLKESGELINSGGLKDSSKEMLNIAEKWRNTSRALIKIGKVIPIKNEEYDDWFNKNKSNLDEGLKSVSNQFNEIADDEKKLFENLLKIAAKL